MTEKDSTQKEIYPGNLPERKVLFFKRQLETLQLWIQIQL